MQKLRVILNAALTRQAWCVRLTPNSPPHVIFQGQVTELDSQNLLTSEDLEQIFAIVMPGQSFNGQSQLTGALNVGSQGILKLRVHAEPLRIDIFTPFGVSLFDQLLSPIPVVNVVPTISTAQSITQLPPVPPPFKPSGEKKQETSGGLQVGDSEPALGAIPLTPPATLPKGAEVMSPGNASVPAVKQVESVPEKVSGQAPEKQSSPSTPALEQGLMFKKSLMAKKGDMPSGVATSKKSHVADSGGLKISGHSSGIKSPSAQRIVEAKAEEQSNEITFGSKEALEGSVSNGQNAIDGFLREMVQMKASDMHLTVGQPVIYRVHGDIVRLSLEQVNADMMRDLLLPTMPKRNHDEFARIHDTDYAYELSGIGRFRVNIFRDRNGVGAVMRHIPSQILTAEQLGLSPAITKLCTLNKGLVLVTGPTGSGKSTTLAAMIDLINKTRKEHILTIEDPIEFVHSQQLCLVNQREVHKHTGSFARALKAALREDPDVVLIGEMRDLETIAIAIETAETGHLVFGTLHTTTAMSTVDRIIDQFPADRQSQIRVMLASSLRGVVAQTLLKKKAGGRVAAHEILIANDAVSAMIREGKVQHLANHMLTQKQDGNQLLNDALLKLVQEGVVDAQEAYFKAVDKNSFIIMAKQRGITINLNSAA